MKIVTDEWRNVIWGGLLIFWVVFLWLPCYIIVSLFWLLSLGHSKKQLQWMLEHEWT